MANTASYEVRESGVHSGNLSCPCPGARTASGWSRLTSAGIGCLWGIRTEVVEGEVFSLVGCDLRKRASRVRSVDARAEYVRKFGSVPPCWLDSHEH